MEAGKQHNMEEKQQDIGGGEAERRRGVAGQDANRTGPRESTPTGGNLAPTVTQLSPLIHNLWVFRTWV